MTEVKICGLKTQDALDAAVESGARFVGFVFYPRSPRAISPEKAADLIGTLPENVKTVGLFVDPTDKDIKKTLEETPLDMIQLHGSESSPRLREIRHAFSLPIIKAIRIGSTKDLDEALTYQENTDWLLFDTKISDNALPGGAGQTFDWSLLEKYDFERPWMLAGGLSETNVGRAIKQLNPRAVDVSSGVESSPGVKDSAKIKAFIEAVKAAD